MGGEFGGCATLGVGGDTGLGGGGGGGVCEVCGGAEPLEGVGGLVGGDTGLGGGGVLDGVGGATTVGGLGP